MRMIIGLSLLTFVACAHATDPQQNGSSQATSSSRTDTGPGNTRTGSPESDRSHTWDREKTGEESAPPREGVTDRQTKPVNEGGGDATSNQGDQ